MPKHVTHAKCQETEKVRQMQIYSKNNTFYWIIKCFHRGSKCNFNAKKPIKAFKNKNEISDLHKYIEPLIVKHFMLGTLNALNESCLIK